MTLKRVVTRRSAKQSLSCASGQLATVLAFPVPPSDVGLVTGLRAGQSDAVSALCERYGAEMLRVAMRVLGPSEDLKPLVGEAVSQAVATIDQLEDPRSLRHWLINHLLVTVQRKLRARRRFSGILAVLRRRLRRCSPPGQWVSGPRGHVRNGTGSVSDDCNDTGTKLTLDTYRILDSLDDRARIVLCLACFDGMEPSEIATVLGISVARVRHLLEHAEVRFERSCAKL